MTTATLSKPAQDLNWLVAGFADRVPGARHAVVASSDGLVVAVSADLDRATADQLAAVTSGLIGIAGCVAQLSDGDEVRQTVIEMGRGYYLTMAIRDGSVLAVVADGDADLGVVGFEMARLAKQTGEILTPALRAELQRALPR
ncbi:MULTISPECIES: roadblock/LC7 domain-containing protein [Catellatospora]|jgi:predicted regulator of Ras-like GTPase activity (Roadblock/LC7/MglB family)|uniref:Dynein regulation protein LC7 n=2 Tax=Catellatospora TaxID=53365 RepID=A0A8J3P8Y2_9ACTN|nr:roadblock/LC7 domain-containing protein [Catellatospora coxensis]GIG08192.1 dynein regulation protein LC7 [Catellatospora coxensis]